MDSKDMIGIWVGAIGWAFAARQTWVAYRERKAHRKVDQLFQAFPWFDGGTQRLSVGIAMMEGFWAELPSHRRLMLPLLANQAIYLLAVSDAPLAQERDNLDRMMQLVLAYPEFAKDFPLIHDELHAITAPNSGRLGPTGTALPSGQIASWHNALSGSPAV